jgi:hypothetical protein
MDIEFLSPPPQEPTSIEMRLSIEPETNNRGEEEKGKTINKREEEKGKTGKYRRGKRKGAKNFMPHTTTLSLIIIKR